MCWRCQLKTISFPAFSEYPVKIFGEEWLNKFSLVISIILVPNIALFQRV